jgi:hypothetical protein
MNSEEVNLFSRLEKLEAQVRRCKLALSAVVMLCASAAVMSLAGPAAADQGTLKVLRLRGLIIEDGQGKPRIIMGAPAPNDGRRRNDPLYGVAYLDADGTDRLTFGQEPDPMTAEGVKPRRVRATGILIHDREGVERGGYAVLDDGMAALTIDWPKSGEAVTMGANNDFAAMAAWHHSPLGQYREAVTIGSVKKSQSGFIRVSDTNSTERVLLSSRGTEQPELSIFDEKGQSLSKRAVT